METCKIAKWDSSWRGRRGEPSPTQHSHTRHHTQHTHERTLNCLLGANICDDAAHGGIWVCLPLLAQKINATVHPNHSQVSAMRAAAALTLPHACMHLIYLESRSAGGYKQSSTR